MIQRSQTLWLLLAVMAALLSFFFPFAIGAGNMADAASGRVQVDATYSFYLSILTVALMVLGFVIIFLYRDRHKQQWYCLLAMLLTALQGALYIRILFYELKEHIPALTSLLAVAQFFGFLMAWRGIRRDQKLIEDQDSLR